MWNMKKIIKREQEVLEHKRLVKLFKKAQKEAAKFVEKNSEIEKRLQIPRTALYS